MNRRQLRNRLQSYKDGTWAAAKKREADSKLFVDAMVKVGEKHPNLSKTDHREFIKLVCDLLPEDHPRKIQLVEKWGL